MSESSSTGLPTLPLARTKPAVLRFSLYYPWAEADNHGSILPYVTTPIKDLLCGNKFYLVSSRINGRNLCLPERTTTTATTEAADEEALSLSSQDISNQFDVDDPYFGNRDYSVLIETPAYVEESELGDVKWMSWTMAFYVVQLGQPIIDMATTQMGSGGIGGRGDGTEDISDLQVSEVMNEVLRLALKVSIMEGDMDNRMQENLPGSHISMKGEEVYTWAKHGIFSDDDVALYGNSGFSSSSQNAPQHSLMDDPMNDRSPSIPTGGSMNARLGSDPSLLQQQQQQQQPQPQRSGPSIVATSMYESHSLRHVGIGMFSTMLFIWILLIRLGIRRRERNDQIQTKNYEQQQRATKNDMSMRNVQLATEDDVSKMLFVGKQVFLRCGCDGSHHHANHDSSLMRISYSRDDEGQACLA